MSLSTRMSTTFSVIEGRQDQKVTAPFSYLSKKVSALNTFGFPHSKREIIKGNQQKRERRELIFITLVPLDQHIVTQNPFAFNNLIENLGSSHFMRPQTYKANIC